MKIAFIITGLGMGGAEKQVCALADQLAENNNVIIISLSKEKILTKPKNSNIKIYSLEMSKTPLGLIYTLIKVREILKNYKPDIIHSHMFHANIFSRVLSIFYKMPVLITTAHSSNEGGKLRMLSYRLTDKLSTITTNVSKEAVDIFIAKKAANPKRIIPIYNGIDTDLFSFSEENRKNKRLELNIPNNTPLLLAVGRLTAAKDYPNLLTAFSQLNHFPKPYLAIIGIGEDKDSLINLTKELNISDRVIWLGLKHDVYKWMSACDIFLLSSAWEGFGLVVAEAMSSERIVIGTNAGGVKEVINEFGAIVPIRDSIALAHFIDRYLNFSLLEKENLQKNARQHIINTFSLDKISSEWISLYKKLLNQK